MFLRGDDNEINELSAVRRFAHQAIPDLSCDRVAILSEGMDMRSYEIDARWVFRFAQHAAASERLRLLAHLLPRLRLQLPVPIPEYRHIGEHASGNVFVAYPKIPGVPLAPEQVARAGAEDQERLLADLGRALTQLHAFPVSEALEAGVRTEDLQARIVRGYERVRGELTEFIDPQTAETLIRLSEAFLSEPSHVAYEPTLLHGRLGPDAILADVRQPALGGLLDFSETSVSDPALDFLHIYRHYGVDFTKRLLKHYANESHRPLKQKIGFLSRWHELEVLLGWLDRDRPDLAMKQRDRLQAAAATWEI